MGEYFSPRETSVENLRLLPWFVKKGETNFGSVILCSD